MFGHVGAFKSIKIQKMPKCMCHWRCQLGDLGIGSFEPNLPLVSNKHVSRCISDSSVRTFYEEVEEKISKFVGFVMFYRICLSWLARLVMGVPRRWKVAGTHRFLTGV